ncbi:MAG: hypothetical protein NZ602_05500, partial [Thermoguttaceae bacterium]|nr:hypothetical protein [Thermoguttaceae bacterium]MDW8038837.1 hypothetical protein [Thermoguttaceae bacterium]
MSVRRRPTASSFELLLDPICNTFGCVIFLCMLVSLLVQNSSERFQELARQFVSPLEASQLRTRHQEIRLRQEQLRSDLEHLDTFLALQSNPGTVHLAKEVYQLQIRLQQMQARHQSLRQAETQIRQKIQNLQKQKEDLLSQTKQTEKQLKELEKQLEAELAERTQTIPFPKERLTHKNSVALDLCFGRLYLWHRYDAQGNRIGLNTDEYVVVEETPQHILTAPKPYAGIPLDDPLAPERIAARLRPFPPAKWHLDFAIFPDSFEYFQKLKRIIIKLGYEYRLVLIAPGGIV